MQSWEAIHHQWHSPLGQTGREGSDTEVHDGAVFAEVVLLLGVFAEFGAEDLQLLAKVVGDVEGDFLNMWRIVRR
ncbi:hypothetical protein D3C77_727260 [compost metagenome]